MKRLFIVCISVLLLLTLFGCNSNEHKDVSTIVLNNDNATINGEVINEFDYTWNVDPTVVHDEVKDAPAEYYTGTKPDNDLDVYIDHELYYYPLLDENKFKLINYDGEQEWAYYYEDGSNNEYIFATLPYLNRELPKDMMHSEVEASDNKVLHIKKAGTYRLQGNWQGQIYIDLGDKDNTYDDPNAKVTLILDNVNINCSVAPGIIFYSAYECDNDWENRNSYSSIIDTKEAGANIIIADNSKNIINGNNIFRMLKTKYKDDQSKDNVKTQKKLRKNDAALYSYVSLNVNGETKGNGKLEINSSFEGLDSELHLTILGGEITINSQDDGINTNEDNVSVTVIKGGDITLNAALGAEGDGIDSNGFVYIEGGTLNINGIRMPDNLIDSEEGIVYKGGDIFAENKSVEIDIGEYKEINSSNKDGFDLSKRGEMIPPEFGERFKDFDIKKFKEEVNKLDENATIEDIYRLLGNDYQNRSQMPKPMDDMKEKPAYNGVK